MAGISADLGVRGIRSAMTDALLGRAKMAFNFAPCGSRVRAAEAALSFCVLHQFG